MLESARCRVHMFALCVFLRGGLHVRFMRLVSCVWYVIISNPNADAASEQCEDIQCENGRRESGTSLRPL